MAMAEDLDGQAAAYTALIVLPQELIQVFPLFLRRRLVRVRERDHRHDVVFVFFSGALGQQENQVVLVIACARR